MNTDNINHVDFKDYAKFTFILRNDGIVHYIVKENALVSIDDIMEHYHYFEKKYKSKKFLNVYEFLDNAEIDDESRKWASNPDGNSFTIADAFVIKSMAQKLLGNFYLTFHKPVKPTKLFNNLDDAVIWLKSLK